VGGGGGGAVAVAGAGGGGGGGRAHFAQPWARQTPVARSATESFFDEYAFNPLAPDFFFNFSTPCI
jgi:hypothetical protein